MAKNNSKQLSLGTYEFTRETKNTRRYELEDDDGRRDTIYIKKKVASKLGDPDAIEVLVKVAEVEDEDEE